VITKAQHKYLSARAEELIKKAGVLLTADELKKMDTADFGLGNPEIEGAQIVPLIDTEKIAMRVIVLLPLQTEPEHWHAGSGDIPGKEETIRVLYGTFYLCAEGEDNRQYARIPEGKDEYYTARYEYVMSPGDTITIPCGTRHWFHAGEHGAVLYSVSTAARDAADPFTDPNVVRVTVLTE